MQFVHDSDLKMFVTGQRPAARNADGVRFPFVSAASPAASTQPDRAALITSTDTAHPHR